MVAACMERMMDAWGVRLPFPSKSWFQTNICRAGHLGESRNSDSCGSMLHSAILSLEIQNHLK